MAGPPRGYWPQPPSTPTKALAVPDKVSALAKFQANNRQLRERWRNWNGAGKLHRFLCKIWGTRYVAQETYGTSDRIKLAVWSVATLAITPGLPFGFAIMMGITAGDSFLRMILFGDEE